MAYGKISGDLLRWHIRPLFDVRHLEVAIAVPIAVLDSREVRCGCRRGACAEWR
jgi:hypothetical protein